MAIPKVTKDWDTKEGGGHSFRGDYAIRPTVIATTEFLKDGVTTKPVTTVKYIDYHGWNVLKTREITDYRRTRNAFGDYPITDPDGEQITVDYKYPWHPSIGLDSLPKALPMTVETHSRRKGGRIDGQDFEYDDDGNIKTVFQFSKGEGSNGSTLSYVHPDYEQKAAFLFENGKPVQMTPENGVPTSYIWGYNGQYPVAKIEGRSRAGINSGLIAQIENETDENTLLGLFSSLRNDPTTANTMVTTYTHNPLVGVKTITDPKGDRITYHYDALGRLEYVTDREGKRLTENKYIYGQ